MPSPEDNEALTKEVLREFQQSAPGTSQARIWRQALKGLLFCYGLGVKGGRLFRRQKKVGEDNADYSFEVKK